MESASAQLPAEFAKHLGRDYADRLADIHRPARRQVAAVAFDTATAPRFAGQDRTNTHALYAGTLNLSRQVLVDFLARFDNHRAFDRIDDVVERSESHNAIAQALDLLPAFNDGCRRNPSQRAAVGLTNDYVLRHVNQTAGQVTRVGCLQRRISQAFARAVRRDEVLQHVKAFAEV